MNRCLVRQELGKNLKREHEMDQIFFFAVFNNQEVMTKFKQNENKYDEK